MLAHMKRVAFALLVASVMGAVATAGPAAVWPDSKSPDGKLGVVVPDRDQVKANQRGNALVEITSGKQLAMIEGDTAGDHMQLDIEPQWSRDGTVLLWYVDGKWGSWAVSVVELDRGKLAWQSDVRGKAVAAALAGARAAQPKLYASVAQHCKDAGAWFHDGFAIDVKLAAGKPVALPMTFEVTMTSDPKDLDSPDMPRFDAHMTATLAADGKLSFGKLAVDKARP